MSFLSHLEWRHATKAFDQSQPLPKGALDQILHAIRLAPTSFGLQPFRVEVIQNEALQAELKPHAWNQAQITTAPALLIFVSRGDVGGRITELMDGMSMGDATARAGLKGYEDMIRGFVAKMDAPSLRDWTMKQAYIALGFGLAACAELKIDSCPIEGFSRPDVNRTLGLTDGDHAAVILAVGVRDPKSAPRPKFRFAEEKLFRRR